MPGDINLEFSYRGEIYQRFQFNPCNITHVNVLDVIVPDQNQLVASPLSSGRVLG